MSKSIIKPVKLISALFYQEEEQLKESYSLLEKSFSTIDFKSDIFDFTQSDYYEEEMGKDLKRILISFTELIQPDFIVEAKLISKKIETQLSENDKRRVNIDPGYLDMFKVVLASNKARANKIYLSQNIWADMVLYFEKGDFRPFLWSFPDFKSGVFNSSLTTIRNNFKKQLKTI